MWQRTQLLVIEKKPNNEIEKRVYHNQWGQGKRMYNGIMSILQSLSDGVSYNGAYEPQLKEVELKSIPSFHEYYRNPISEEDQALLDQAKVEDISTIKRLFESLCNNDGGAVVEVEWLKGKKCSAYNNCQPFTMWADNVLKSIGSEILACVGHTDYVNIHHIDYPTDDSIVVHLADGYGRELKDTITLNFILSEDKLNIEKIKITNKGSHGTTERSVDGPVNLDEVMNHIFYMLDQYLPDYKVKVGFLLGYICNEKLLLEDDDSEFKKYVSPERFRQVEGYCGKEAYFDNNFFNAFKAFCKYSEVSWLHDADNE